MEISYWSIIYGLFSFIAGFISLGIAIYLSPHWKNISARLLTLLVICIAVWSFGYGMEFFSPDLALKLWWVKIEYFGNVWLGPILFSFILSITQKPLKHRTSYILLSILPVIFIALVLTNDLHHLMWERAWIETDSRVAFLMYDRAAFFWIYVAYSYSLILIATVRMVRSFSSATGIFKKQLFVILLGVASPWVANIIYVFGFESLKHIDFTPTAFTISGIAFFFGLLRYQMLSLIPLAHETMINSMGDPVIAVDMRSRVLDMNKAAMAQCDTDFITPAHSSLETFFPSLADLVSQHQSTESIELETNFHDGQEAKTWGLRIFPLLGRKNKHRGRLLILKDITDKKRAENAAKEGERIQRVVLQASPNPIVYYNQNGEVTYLNPAFTRVFGWTLDELLGKRIDFVPKENLEETKAALKKTIERPEGNYGFLTRRSTKSGKILDVSINSAMHHPQDGSPPNMVVNFADITQIKQTERELRKTRDYITSIINSLPSILIGLNAEGIITQWNKQAEKLTGVMATNAIDHSIKDIFPQLAVFVMDIYRILESRKAQKETKRNLTINNKTIIVDIAIYPIISDSPPGVVIRIDDISDRVKIEEMMIQSEKMMSVGGLAAGMAHEINNPLAGIIQNTQVIKNRLTRPLPANIQAARECDVALEKMNTYMEKRNIFTMMDQVVKSGLRAAHIVDNMLSFSRKSGQRKSTHYLHEIMESTIELVGNDYNLKKRYDFRAIKIIRDYSDNVPPVICEKNKIQQVLLNILKNGAEAMAEANTADPGLCIRCFKDKDMVTLEIEDNGPGMDEKTKKRIFEPFFTTKEVGVGTGLGLSVSYFIITENHDGIMTVESFLGQGTRFIIKLPYRQTRKGS